MEVLFIDANGIIAYTATAHFFIFAIITARDGRINFRLFTYA